MSNTERNNITKTEINISNFMDAIKDELFYKHKLTGMSYNKINHSDYLHIHFALENLTEAQVKETWQLLADTANDYDYVINRNNNNGFEIQPYNQRVLFFADLLPSMLFD